MQKGLLQWGYMGQSILDCEPSGAEVLFSVPRQEGYRKLQGKVIVHSWIALLLWT